MKPFMDRDFLLTTPTAQHLFHDIAEKMPILDYHCHISPEEIAKDRRFENMTQVWLGGDHYKWRQMRSNGIDEYYITGDAPDYEKFLKWAETLEKAVGNPLFHWSHLELQRYFGYYGVLDTDTAPEVWKICSRKLQEPSMSARNLIRHSGVTLLCTTDDPADDLRWHRILKEDPEFTVQVLPAWRPDKAMNIEKPDYVDYLKRLEEAADMKIESFRDLKEALCRRMDFFDSMGCRVSDHALEYIMYVPETEENLEKIFSSRLAEGTVSKEEELKFKTAFMSFVTGEYVERGWAMQLHCGCRRDNNRRMFSRLGPDTGYDCISNYSPAGQMADFLNGLQEEGRLPRTIIYSLDPGDDELIGSLIGCFQDGSAVGKLQQGAAWWFNDHKQGMVKQMTSLANLGLLGNFIGMLTDSRSFLSYPRHEYFRRILCELIGGWVENGEYPCDEKRLERLIKGISYNNAVRYFGFDLEER